MDFMTFLKKRFYENMEKRIEKGPLACRKWLLLPHVDPLPKTIEKQSLTNVRQITHLWDHFEDMQL